MQSLNFVLAAGESKHIPCPGRGFWYESGTSTTTNGYISVRPDNGTEIVLKPGQHFNGPGNGSPSTIWTVTAIDPAAALTGKIIIGDGDFGDDGIAGNVQVVDGGKTRTLAANVFWGYGYAAPVAAQFAWVQLWNPATNTKRLIVSQLTYAVNQAAAAIGHAGSNNVALATLVGNAKNKLFGAAVSSAEIRTVTSAAAPGGYVAFADLYAPGGINQILKPTEPFVVLPGQGLIIELNAAANIGLSGQFEFYEELI